MTFASCSQDHAPIEILATGHKRGTCSLELLIDVRQRQSYVTKAASNVRKSSIPPQTE